MKKKLIIGMIIYIILFVLGKIVLNYFDMEYLAYFYNLSFILLGIIVFIVTYLIYKEDKMNKVKGGIIVLISEYVIEVFIMVIIYGIVLFAGDLEKEKIITENNELYVLRYESTWPDYSAIKKYKCVTFFIRKKEPVEVNVINS